MAKIFSVLLGACVVLASSAALAQGTLRIGMTASDIPLTTGQTDQGGEGMRFMGYALYDGLINWDLSKADKASDLVPGLATGWSVDAVDKTKWIFTLREGVKFHDGSEFTTEAVVWNFDKLLNNDAPQFDQRQAAQGRSRIPAVGGYKVVDTYKVEITTKSPDATLPYQIAWIMMSSPTQWEKLGKSWDNFAKTPSGTGPWQLTAFTPRERAELVPFPGYWDQARVPKLEKMVLLPLPMNEFVQQNLAEIGIKVDFEVVEWNTLINIWRAGAKHASSRAATGMNYTYFIQDPFTGVVRHLQCNLVPPAGTNWGMYCDPEMDKLFDQIRTTFDPAEQTKVMQKIHEKYVDEALFLMVTHDVNPRAMSPRVKGFIQAQNWFQDFSPITMAPR